LEQIRVLAENGVDVGMGDYDGRTPLHLAACAGKTSVIEYLLQQPTVSVNAVDRFGGTPLEDAIRHNKQGAAALLREKGACCSGDGQLEEVARKMFADREAKLKAVRQPKIQHMIRNSQESNAFRSVGKTLRLAIPEQRAKIEPAVQRLIWAIRGLATRLAANQGKIPRDDAFRKSAEHVLNLSTEMRGAVLASRSVFNNELNDESTVECIIWKKASTLYKKEAATLDQHLRRLLLVTKATRRLVKQIVKVAKRQKFLVQGGERTSRGQYHQDMPGPRRRLRPDLMGLNFASNAGWNAGTSASARPKNGGPTLSPLRQLPSQEHFFTGPLRIRKTGR